MKTKNSLPKNTLLIILNGFYLLSDNVTFDNGHLQPPDTVMFLYRGTLLLNRVEDCEFHWRQRTTDNDHL